MDKKILVVDDFPTMRKIIIDQLHQIGFTDIQEVGDGDDAIRFLKERPVDILITDWNMPNMSGLDLVKSVRKNPKLQNMKILMITAEAKKEQIVAAAAAGANGYILKPFDKETLKAKIDKIL